MTDTEWMLFLKTARQILGKGASVSWASESWCAFTTFTSLEHQVTYWSNGLPDERELLEDKTKDGGLWGQSFYYKDLAHIIIPAKFYWEKIDSKGSFHSGYKNQNIKTLERELSSKGIANRVTDKVLEIELY